MSEVRIEQLRQALLGQSFLFDDPYSYQCGVEDTLTAVRASIVSSELADAAVETLSVLATG